MINGVLNCIIAFNKSHGKLDDGKAEANLKQEEEETLRVENRVVSEFEHRAEMTRTALSTVVTGDS